MESNKSHEEIYAQHKRDAEAFETVKHMVDENIEIVKESGIGDIERNPGLYDEASANYQAWAQKEIIRAVERGDFEGARMLMSGVEEHWRTINNTEYEQKSLNSIEDDTIDQIIMDLKSKAGPRTFHMERNGALMTDEEKDKRSKEAEVVEKWDK